MDHFKQQGKMGSACMEGKKNPCADSITGKELQKLREQQIKTVQEFADMLNVTPATIYRWEKLTTALNLNSNSKQSLEYFLASLEG
jgi:DNA-binding transcriptional regulator YiaG